MLSHVDDILTAMGKHGDGSLPQSLEEASDLIASGSKDKAYLSHMNNFIEEVGSGATTAKVKVLNISLHSYQGKRPQVCDDKYSNPPGFEVRHLNVEPEEVTAAIDAHSRGTRYFHKVDPGHVYEVATGQDTAILPFTKGQITPWRYNYTFPIAPPGSELPIPYTPASAAMLRCGDPPVLASDRRQGRVLVPFIPKDAQVQTTVLDPITATGTTVQDEVHTSLRHDLMLICHAMQSPHHSRVDTMRALRTMAYEPSA